MTYAIDPELLPWLDMLPAVTLTDYEALVAARSAMGQLGEVLPAYEPANPVDVRDTSGASDGPGTDVSRTSTGFAAS